MKKVLLVCGILMMIVCILLLLFAMLNLYGYYNVMDGTEALYDRLHQRMIVSFAAGTVFGIIGIACFIIRSKK